MTNHYGIKLDMYRWDNNPKIYIKYTKRLVSPVALSWAPCDNRNLLQNSACLFQADSPKEDLDLETRKSHLGTDSLDLDGG